MGSPPPPPTSDTRPYRGPRVPAYAGCMTVVRAAAIDSAYSLGPSHRCGLWVRRPTFQIDEHLVQLLLEAGHGLVQGGARCSRCSDGALGLLVAPAARCSDSGAGCTPCSRGGRPLDSSLRWNDGRRCGMVRQAHHERPVLQHQRAHHERPLLQHQRAHHERRAGACARRATWYRLHRRGGTTP